MVESLNLDATITTTFERVYDFARMLCKTWSPAFYLSITRDGKKEFSDSRFDTWLELNKKKFNWNILYPHDVCNAKVLSGKNRGMRCSKKQKPIVVVVKNEETGEMEEELEDTGFCGVHKNTKNKWDKCGYVDQRTKDKFLYNGEPPMVNRSDKIIRMMKRKVKIPKTFMNDEGPDEEDLIKTIERISINVNKLMDKSIYHDNQHKSLRKSIDWIINGNKYLANIIDNNEKGEDHKRMLKYNLYENDDRIDKKDFDLLVANNPIATFEELATPEQLQKVQEQENEYKRKNEANSLKYILADHNAKMRESGLLEKFNELIAQHKLMEPTRQELADSLQKEHVTPTNFVFVTKEDKEKVIEAEGVGKDSRTANNLFNKYVYKSLDKSNYLDKDNNCIKEMRALWKQGKAFSPFIDPSIDPLQDDIRTIIVKKDENDKEWTWIEYHKQLRTRIVVFNKFLDRIPEKRQDFLSPEELVVLSDFEANMEVVKRKMEKVLNSYGIRPRNKVELLDSMKEIDFASLIMKQSIVEYKDKFDY